MRSDFYIKWDMYARQDDLVLKRYCRNHIGYGFEVFFETAIMLKKNDGNPIAKQDIIDCVQETTLIEYSKVAECIDALIECELLKEEDGKFYSARIKRDIEDAQKLSERQKNNIQKRWNTGKADSGKKVVIPSGNTVEYQTIDNRQETRDKRQVIEKENIKEKSSKFVKPSLEEVKAYCEERNNHVDPEAFIAYYESNGWHVGRDKMHSWKSAVITWEKRDKNKIASLPINKRPQVGYRPEDYKDVPETGIF